jgi:tetratricopeptide (TPR) repeat protein
MSGMRSMRRILAGIVWMALMAAPAAAKTASAHHAITTSVPEAQAAFDRGLAMLYAFSIGEARTAFAVAEHADPQAAMPYWGEAVAETIDINLPSTPEGERRAAIAIAHARAARAASADERALIAAAALRFDVSKSREQRFRAYFDAMQKYADAHPADGMALTLSAYAGWNTVATFTNADGTLTPDAQKMAADLDAALALDADDIGAHHLRIHFWESAKHPERALPDADYLAALDYDPAESHLQHMAGHTYVRVGDYADTVTTNEAACAYDETYFKLGDGDGQRYMHRYHDHDVSFVLYGLTTVGRVDEARAFASHESLAMQERVATRLHDDQTLLHLLGASVSSLRVIAETRLGQVDEARHDLAIAAHNVANDDPQLAVAQAVLAHAQHDDTAALADYERARAATRGDLGDPKTLWYTPVGEGYAVTLLAAGRAADAERIFRSELVAYPNDPHLEFGLAEALKAQHKDDTDARAAYVANWKGEKPLTLADLG